MARRNLQWLVCVFLLTGHVFAQSWRISNFQDVISINADGSNGRQITAEYEDQMPSVTSDGRTIIFQSNRSRGSDIWRANIDGSNARQLTTCGRNLHPGVSPDGNWVVYQSNCDGVGGLWRVAVSGGEPQRISETSFSWPAVSPDGKWKISDSDVKVINVYGSDFYPELTKSNVQVYHSLMYRHWDTWSDGTRSHVFVMPAAGGDAIDVMKAMDADSHVLMSDYLSVRRLSPVRLPAAAG